MNTFPLIYILFFIGSHYAPVETKQILITTPDGVILWERSPSGWISEKAEWKNDGLVVVVKKPNGEVKKTDLSSHIQLDDKLLTLLNGQGLMPMRKEGEQTTKGFHYRYTPNPANESKIECSIEYKK